MADLASAITRLLNAKRISAPTQSYAKDNGVESGGVFAYLRGGARPTAVATEMGLGLVEVEDVRRAPAPPAQTIRADVAVSAPTGTVTT